MPKKLTTRVRELSKSQNVPRAQHGRLAEDYDGIGQYILVSCLLVLLQLPTGLGLLLVISAPVR